MPSGDEGGHVEGTAGLGAPSKGGAPAAKKGGISGQRCDSDEGADFPPRELTELRHIGDQGGHGGAPYPFDAGEQRREIGVLMGDVARQLADEDRARPYELERS